MNHPLVIGVSSLSLKREVDSICIVLLLILNCYHCSEQIKILAKVSALFAINHQTHSNTSAGDD